jgi:hypothetical protein
MCVSASGAPGPMCARVRACSASSVGVACTIREGYAPGITKIVQGSPKLWANFRALMGIFIAVEILGQVSQFGPTPGTIFVHALYRPRLSQAR